MNPHDSVPDTAMDDVITGGGRMKIGTRRYQVDAVRACITELRDGGRGQLISACGTGKTVMCQRVAELVCAPGGVVVIACPSIALVLQVLREWNQTNHDHVALAVCGDDSVGDCAATAADLPGSVTTSPETVAAWLRRPAVTAIRLIVSTHRSAHLVGEGMRRAGTVAELLIVDEAHRSAGRVDKHTALLHDDQQIAAVRRVYTTATPKVVRAGRKRCGPERVGMDNQGVYGPELFRYTVAEAIAEGYLDNYRLVVMGVTRREILEHLACLPREAVASLSSPTGLHTAMVQTVLARAAVQFGLRRVLTFCRRVNESREFARTMARTLQALPADLRPARPLHAAHVDGTMPVSERERILATLVTPPDEGWTVVSNVRCLSEGVDVPSVDAVAFTSPKQSVIDIIQAVGRALRRNPEGSGVATILVPILLPDDPVEVEDVDSQVWQVVRALRAHDTVLGEALDRGRADLGRRDGDPQPLEQIVVNLPEGYDDGRFLRYLNARIISTSTTSWWDGYGHLTRFHGEHGHAHAGGDDVADDGSETGYALGAWADRCRDSHRRGVLPADRAEALRELGFDFEPDAVAWHAGIGAARKFHAKNGHLEPVRSTKVDGVELRSWLDKQRSRAAAGSLSAERIAQLDTLSMRWGAEPATFDEYLSILRAYYDEHGHITIAPDPATPLGRVGEWLIHIRIQHRLRKLTDDQVAALDALGMQWTTRTGSALMPQFSAPLS